jgi:exodeoxyribonuclease VII large subunit
MIRRLLTVSQINYFVKSILSTNSLLKNIEVEGEISNFKAYPSGHLYFSLKDEKSKLSCVMFAGKATQLNFFPQDGIHVTCRGAIDVYERNGQYQLYVDSMGLKGSGDWFVALQRLKDYLDRLGYFNEENKKKLPDRIKTVGVVTSGKGAAIHDIITTIRKRDSSINIIFCPAQVQGEGAAEEIVEGIAKLNDRSDVDVIIVGRGGGSIEDLWAFNEKKVADAIFTSRKPIISAVGHETDNTISDLVADIRAATPTAAGEIVSQDKKNSYDQLFLLKERLEQSLHRIISQKKQALDYTKRILEAKNPGNIIQIKRINLQNNAKNLFWVMQRKIFAYRSQMTLLQQQLQLSNPRHVLEKGYAIIYAPDHTVVESASKAYQLDQLSIGFKDGEVKVFLNREEENGTKENI